MKPEVLKEVLQALRTAMHKLMAKGEADTEIPSETPPEVAAVPEHDPEDAEIATKKKSKFRAFGMRAE